VQQENRLKQMGATVRNAGSYIERLKQNEEREKMARNAMEKMSIEQLSELLAFYHTMGQISSEILEKKIHHIVDI
jgi:orotate phosphoribosyltransferase